MRRGFNMNHHNQFFFFFQIFHNHIFQSIDSYYELDQILRDFDKQHSFLSFRFFQSNFNKDFTSINMTYENEHKTDEDIHTSMIKSHVYNNPTFIRLGTESEILWNIFQKAVVLAAAFVPLWGRG